MSLFDVLAYVAFGYVILSLAIDLHRKDYTNLLVLMVAFTTMLFCLGAAGIFIN
tara:strand:- start:10 stop:171 length:162 start_codon:yes stop_codon:yes gene_type:complete